MTIGSPVGTVTTYTHTPDGYRKFTIPSRTVTVRYPRR